MNVMKELGNAMRRRAKVAAAASEVQLEANRANARRSTGPRTTEGKARSSGNATKYGLYSSRVLLPGEDAAEYAALRDGMYERLKPVGELERLIADRAVVAAWKLRRVQSAEAARYRLLCDEYAAWDDEPTALPAAAEMIGASDDVFERYARWEAAQERSMYRALRELRRVQADRAGKDVEESESNAPAEAPATPQHENERNEPISESAGTVDATCDDVNDQNEPISPPAPSPGTPGEGRGEGDFERRATPVEPKSPSS